MTSSISPTPIDIKTLNFAPTSAIVSRVKRFLDYPDKISPVSCTMVSVCDSYFQEKDSNGEEKYHLYETISGSRTYLTKVIKGNAGCLVDLSKLRPKGSIGSNGMESHGVTNFMGIYSAINQEVRRGSVFKNGATVLSLHWQHPDLIDFLNFPASEIPWAKRAITVTEDILLPENSLALEAVLKALANGIIFVNKQVYNAKGEPLFPNVCTSIRLKSRSTCTLLPINLGMVRTIEEIVPAFINGANDIIKIWNLFLEAKLRQGEHFLDPREDKQAGLGLLGLANLLANLEISYYDFAEAMWWVVIPDYDYDEDEINFWGDNPKAAHLAKAFQSGYAAAAKIAKAEGFERFFAIEPTASVSYANVDYNGFTCTPEISPPVCHPDTKISQRRNDSGYENFQYPLGVEIAEKDVSWETYFSLCCSFQTLQEQTGLSHGTNFNFWVSQPVTKEWFQEWFDSSLISIYYRWSTDFQSQDKSSIGVEVTKESESFWAVEDYEEEVEEGKVCVITQQSSGGGCSACEGE
jgi:Ribonucleotide reductase, barrel domain